jgi:pyridoxine 4-dehydrogenase
LVRKIEDFAEKKHITPAQLALAWIRAYSNTDDCGVIMPIPGATSADRVVENCKLIDIALEERHELDSLVKSYNVVGHRQIAGWDGNLWT